VAKFKHHSYFSKSGVEQQFRFPFVCVTCRKSFKYPASRAERVCPQCGGPMVMLSRKFSAPRAKDIVQWRKVKYLVDNGFRFYSVYQITEGGGQHAVRYPATLQEAEAFVQKFKSQVAPNKLTS
jgi:DNA-directed RNA polymerase subunit RPC12/RpoP